MLIWLLNIAVWYGIELKHSKAQLAIVNFDVGDKRRASISDVVTFSKKIFAQYMLQRVISVSSIAIDRLVNMMKGSSKKSNIFLWKYTAS